MANFSDFTSTCGCGRGRWDWVGWLLGVRAVLLHIRWTIVVIVLPLLLYLYMQLEGILRRSKFIQIVWFYDTMGGPW